MAIEIKMLANMIFLQILITKIISTVRSVPSGTNGAIIHPRGGGTAGKPIAVGEVFHGTLKLTERLNLHMRYRAPSPENLRALKTSIGRTGEQMAELFGVAGGQQWRKYTGGAEPRELSPQILFFGAARLALTPDELERVLARMREIGAEVDL